MTRSTLLPLDGRWRWVVEDVSGPVATILYVGHCDTREQAEQALERALDHVREANRLAGLRGAL